MKVLVADSEAVIADLVEVLFTKSGKHSVVKANDTMTAVDVAKDNPDIGLVLLDTDCLGEGGVTDTLRNHLCPGCKIVLYSGAVIGDEDPKDFGVDLVVPKHHYPPELFETIAQACAA